MNRSIYALALLASVAACHASPAFASTPSNPDRDNNNASAQSNAISNAGATADSAAVAVGVGVGYGGDALAGANARSGDVRGDIRSDIDIGLGQSSVLTSKTDLSNSQGQDQKQDQSQTQQTSITDSGNAAQSQSTENANNAKQSVNITNPKQAAASAFSSGSAGVGTCRFGPGGGFQQYGFGASVTLPIFKDKTCDTLGVADMLLRAGANEAAIQYLSSRDKAVNAAVTQARKSGNN